MYFKYDGLVLLFLFNFFIIEETQNLKYDNRFL